MIIYNVTCSMEKSLAAEWLDWMLAEHIPEVMATGCFLEYRVMKLLTTAPDDTGVNYAIQYTAAAMPDYDRYREIYAPALQQKTRDRFGDQVTAFRSLLEDIKR